MVLAIFPAMKFDADIIVVGAGPAGSTAAKLLADRGYQVLLLDRAAFPRHKTCASWINRLAFERFPYLQSRLDLLAENPFYGVTFNDRGIARQGSFAEKKPSGYLSLRSKFDDGLRRIAVEAGAEFLGGSGVQGVEESKEGVTVRIMDGRTFNARIAIGADGTSSRVAVATGLRKQWGPRDYVLCANVDYSFPPAQLQSLYGGRAPLRVYLEYQGIQGYGWVFPKRAHLCVGIGAMLDDGRRIRGLFAEFVHDLQARGHIPSQLPADRVYYDLDPVGAVYQMPALTRDRVMLIGDAAGFVSGTTGEGIYPGMVSAELAAKVIHRALAGGSVGHGLEGYNAIWRSELGDYVKRLPGGEQEGKTRSRIDLIFRSKLAARLAGRIFLYGEQLSFQTFRRALWP
jgi:geranylgeranyl reductase family protein